MNPNVTSRLSITLHGYLSHHSYVRKSCSGLQLARILLMPRARIAIVAKSLLATIVLGSVVFAFRASGDFLVVDNREQSDAIVITQADSLDSAYWMGLNLLNSGYGREMLIDARSNRMFFGRTQADWAGEFIKTTAAALDDRVRVCPIVADTTAEEAYDVVNCLKGRSIHSVMLVVHDFHCRRSLSMFSRLLPQYRWSVAAVPDNTRFGRHWWRRREWIRTTMIEWQHMLWWQIVDRWRYLPVVSAM